MLEIRVRHTTGSRGKALRSRDGHGREARGGGGYLRRRIRFLSKRVVLGIRCGQLFRTVLRGGCAAALRLLARGCATATRAATEFIDRAFILFVFYEER